MQISIVLHVASFSRLCKRHGGYQKVWNEYTINPAK